MDITITGKNNTLPSSWGDGCQAWTLLETGDLSVKTETMPPGTREKIHHHERARQYFYILTGAAVFTIGGQEYRVDPGYGIHIPPGTEHFIRNEGTESLDFLVISQPSTRNDRVEKQPVS